MDDNLMYSDNVKDILKSLFEINSNFEYDNYSGYNPVCEQKKATYDRLVRLADKLGMKELYDNTEHDKYIESEAKKIATSIVEKMKSDINKD